MNAIMFVRVAARVMCVV